jgi:hypothetical protein
MPLKLNIGASRKVTDNNYGSRGASVNLEMELDTTLATDPPKLQEKIRYLFQVARTSLAEELNGAGHHANGQSGPAGKGEPPSGDPAVTNGDGRQHNWQDPAPRRSTASQCKALHAIARAHSIHLGDYLHHYYQAFRPEDLTIRQASEAIDNLKASSVRAEAGS